MAQPRVAPGAQVPPPEHAPNADHAPHAHVAASQLRERLRLPVPQLPQASDSIWVSPGEHSPVPPPMHAPKADQAPQLQLPLQVRVRVRVPVPQVPQASELVSIMPSVHSPSSAQAHAPQVQSRPQVRAWTPHIPQRAPIWTSPMGQSPPPLHAPSSRHVPPSQTWRCIPQLLHGTIRGGSPGAQAHEVGAVHAAQRPSMQRSTPALHAELQGRSAIRPTLGLASSQSRSEGTPSPSTSMAATQVPPSQL